MLSYTSDNQIQFTEHAAGYSCDFFIKTVPLLAIPPFCNGFKKYMQ